MIRYLFFIVILRPLLLIILGVNVRQRHLLPTEGPALLVANHNSHIDTLVIMSLFPQRLLPKLHPVAAADYFLRSKLLAWFSLNIIGIIPIQRKSTTHTIDPLDAVYQAIEENSIIIFYPEGSRGDPEQLIPFKSGIAHIAKQFPHLPIIPIFIHGAGKALPKGEALLVPFCIDVYVEEPLYWQGDKQQFMQMLQEVFTARSKRYEL
ncbi:MAG TPA: lysophospholipid acyltransferase family protein [Gammaproteobacteria bacterium]|nr:lysophospholipid acyltransferase family protein [Gammaproteobacteria bacterium]